MKIEHGMNIGTPKKNSNSTEVNLRLIDVHESLLWLLGNIEQVKQTCQAVMFV
jgi:hypothetical protein